MYFNELDKKSIVLFLAAVVVIMAVVIGVDMSKGSTPKKTTLRNIGQLNNKMGMNLAIFELVSEHFVCIIPVHTYVRDKASAVPFMECEKK